MNYTLSEINQEINRLAALDIKNASFGLERLIENLMRNDNFYILVPNKNTKKQLETKYVIPYIAPLLDSNLMFLRLFSHEQAAEDFANMLGKKSEYSICKINTIESIQMFKYLFLLGIEGFVLNDGQVWTTVSLDKYLTLFYEKTLKTKTGIDNNYLSTVKLIKILILGENKISFQKKGTHYVLNDYIENKSKNIFTIDTLETLIDSEAKARIIYPSISINESVTKIKPVFYEISLLKKSLGLSLYEPISQDNIDTILGKSFDYENINPYLTYERPKLPKKILKDSVVRPKNPLFVFTMIKKGKSNSKSFFSKKALPILIATGIITVSLIYFGFSYWNMMESLSSFKKNLNSGNYTESMLIYDAYNKNSHFKAKANPCISDELYDLLDKYINKQISEDEFLTTYNLFKNLNCESELLDVYEKFNIVKASDYYFECGKAATTSLTRLYYWQYVNELDANNYKEAKSDFIQNSDKYYVLSVNLLDALIKELKTEDVFRAIDALDYWYPDRQDLYRQKAKALALGQYDTSNTVSSSSIFNPYNNTTETPVVVSHINTIYCPEKNSVDLFINWKNGSGKIIKEVDFFVIPKGDANDLVETPDSYSMFCARDVGPYSSGKGTPSSNWAWKSVWTGDLVKGAKLLQIIVFFSDNSILCNEF